MYTNIIRNNRVVSLWYRAPELLLGSNLYGPPVDCWAVGCVLGELLNKKPLIPGKNEMDQISLIFALLGEHLYMLIDWLVNQLVENCLYL